MLALAAVIGAASGLAIVAFYGSVDLVQVGVRSAAGWIGAEEAARWSPLLVLPLGLIAARWLRRPEDRERGGTMIPQLIVSAAGRGGDLGARRVGRGLLSAAVTLGTGGPLGSEGPVALAGGTVGSMAGRLFGFRPGRVKVLLACGAAAGISAAFHAPIAGVMFALEIVLGSFAVVALTPVIVASVLGAVVSRVYLGGTPAFQVPTEFALASVPQLGFYVLLALGTGLLSIVFVRGFYWIQDLLGRLPDRRVLAPVVAGILVAAGGLLYPELSGPGREGIQLMLFGQLAGASALLLGLMKIVASGLTMGGGGAGGVFTPSLFVGAGFGSFFGLTLQQLLPGLGVSPGAFALVGMAGLLAGSTAAPLTAILIVFEMTGDYGLILPLMLVCVLSYLTADRLSGESLYSVALDRQGEKIRHGVDLSVLQSVRVAECYDRDPVTLRRESPFRDILSALRESGQLDFPVVSEDGRLAGVISYQQLARALAEKELADLLVAADLMMEEPEKVEPDDSLLLAMQRMSARDLDFIPVVEAGDEGRLVGLLRRADIMETYQAHLMLPD
jgi:CIC family chloride channel protein